MLLYNFQLVMAWIWRIQCNIIFDNERILRTNCMSVSKNNPLIKIKRQFACRGAHTRNNDFLWLILEYLKKTTGAKGLKARTMTKKFDWAASKRQDEAVASSRFSPKIEKKKRLLGKIIPSWTRLIFFSRNTSWKNAKNSRVSELLDLKQF